MLENLFHAPSVLTMHEARQQFLHNNQIRLPTSGYLPVEGGDIWRHRRTRAVAREMHAWLFYYYLRPFSNDDDKTILRKLVQLISHWREIVELPPSRIPLAYHDEATAQRAIALSCLLTDYGDDLSGRELELIKQIMDETVELLTDEEFYSADTNHGMYQDLGLLTLSAHHHRGEAIRTFAITRLNNYFSNAFTSEGIHKEHSPQYHFIVSHHLKHYARYLESIDPEEARKFRELFNQTHEYALHSITPTGKFPPVSDTVNKPISSLGISQTYDSPEFQFALTQGLVGNVPKRNTLIADDTGVAIFREDWQNPNTLYLYFSAAYNSDYHKHSDELSIYLIYRGIEILREAGPNGYEMDDRFTEYAFSSFGHNTLVVNGNSLPRTDPNARGKVGLERNGQDGEFSVTGWNARFPGVEHRRAIAVQAGLPSAQEHSIRVADTIEGDSANSYELLWHFGPEIQVKIEGQRVTLYSQSEQELGAIDITSTQEFTLSLVKAQREPQLQGWYFPEMGSPTPSQTLIVAFTGNARLQTDVILV